MGGANFVTLGPVPDPNSDNVTVGIINASVAANTVTLVTAVAGKRIAVFGMFFTGNSAGPVVFQDSATILTGTIALSSGVPVVLPFQQYPWFTVAAGDAFNVSGTGTVQVSGRIIYMQG